MEGWVGLQLDYLRCKFATNRVWQYCKHCWVKYIVFHFLLRYVDQYCRTVMNDLHCVCVWCVQRFRAVFPPDAGASTSERGRVWSAGDWQGAYHIDTWTCFIDLLQTRHRHAVVCSPVARCAYREHWRRPVCLCCRGAIRLELAVRWSATSVEGRLKGSCLRTPDHDCKRLCISVCVTLCSLLVVLILILHIFPETAVWQVEFSVMNRHCDELFLRRVVMISARSVFHSFVVPCFLTFGAIYGVFFA